MSSAPSEVACPECGKVGTRQLRAGAGLAFKGSGFYLTDYGKNAHRGEGTKSSLDPSSVVPKAETKSDSSKSESKGDSSKSERKSDSAPAKSESSAPKSDTPKQTTESKPAKKPKSE